MAVKIEALYSGTGQFLGQSGYRSGIIKSSIDTVKVGVLGIEGDIQVDKRYHGGPDKALHQFAIINYSRIVDQYPALAGLATPGSIGENISAGSMDETTVCIGDTYRFGKITVQVSEPRQPCWKVNHRYHVERLSEFIEREKISGWYYRVLEGGAITVEDEIILIERPNPTITIYHINEIKGQHRPAPENLAKLISGVGLASGLKRRLQERLDYINKGGRVR